MNDLVLIWGQAVSLGAHPHLLILINSAEQVDLVAVGPVPWHCVFVFEAPRRGRWWWEAGLGKLYGEDGGSATLVPCRWHQQQQEIFPWRLNTWFSCMLNTITLQTWLLKRKPLSFFCFYKSTSNCEVTPPSPRGLKKKTVCTLERQSILVKATCSCWTRSFFIKKHG